MPHLITEHELTQAIRIWDHRWQRSDLGDVANMDWQTIERVTRLAAGGLGCPAQMRGESIDQWSGRFAHAVFQINAGLGRDE